MEKESRPSWDNPMQFILACVSYAVGLGNVWRFPYLCQMHGGGGFMIPYLVMLVLEGIPLFCMELAIGQKMRLGSIGAWSAISPYLGGVGGCRSGGCILWIKPTLESLSIINTAPELVMSHYLINDSDLQVVYFTATFPYLVLLVYLIRGVTLHGALNGVKYMFTPKLEQLANPQTWINAATQIFFSLGLGFGSLIAFSSYNHHNNDFEKQAIAVSLINSGTSIFASVVTFSIYGFKATYNYENCLERSLLLINTFDLAEESIHKQNISFWISELNQTHPDQFGLISSRVEHCSLEQELDTAVEGTGLAFIVYSEAITNMPAAQLWSVLYFFMLLLLGMGSMLGNVMAIITPLRDFKPLARSLVCAFCLLLGIGFTTPAGNYWFTMFNEYGATFSLLFIVLIEVFTVSYIYGLKRFEKDVEDMLGRRPGWYWKVMWAAVSPLLLISLFIFYIINYIQGGVPTYQAWDKEKGRLVVTEYPVFGQAFIGVLLVSSVSCIPLAALYAFCTRHQRGVPVRKGSARSRTSSV
uniref:Transporter n=1 Tax=Astyanax mexicanus TaxID=7994 RepID=W5JXE3_ASTMX